MTKLELIYNVREKLRIHSDDSDITDEYISHLIDIKRVKLLKQRLASNPWRAPIEFMQELCLELEQAESIEGETCFGTILRTKEALPNLLRYKGSLSGITIRTPDRKKLEINLVDISRLPLVGESPFTSQLIYAAFDYDNRVYLVSSQRKHLLMKQVRVAGTWEDIELAGKYECGVDQTCDTWERQYPLELGIVDDVITLVVQDLVKVLQIPEDKQNDATEEKA